MLPELIVFALIFYLLAGLKFGGCVQKTPENWLHFNCINCQFIAHIGNELNNGDRVNGPAHGGATIVEYEGADPIPGLFDRNYIPA